MQSGGIKHLQDKEEAMTLKTQKEIDKAAKRFAIRTVVCFLVGLAIGYFGSRAVVDISSGARFFITTGTGLVAAGAHIISTSFKPM